jgi:ATP-binding cassette subfamily B protein
MKGCNQKRRSSTKSGLRTVTRIMSFAGPYRKLLYLGFFLLIPDVVFSVGIVVAIQNIVNAMAEQQIGRLNYLLIVNLIIVIACVILSMLGTAFRKYASFQINKRMTDMLLKHVNKLPFGYIQDNHTGDLVERVNTDVGKAVSAVNDDGIVRLVTNLLISISAFVYLSNIDLKLTLLAVATGPVTFLSGRFFDKKIRKTSESLNKKGGELRGIFQEFLQSMPIVRTLALDKVFSDKFMLKKGEQMALTRRKAVLNNLMWRIVVTVNFSVTILLTYYIAMESMKGNMSIGSVLSFVFLLGRLQWPFVNISSTWGTIQNALGAADRIFTILDIETEDILADGGLAAKEEDGKHLLREDCSHISSEDISNNCQKVLDIVNMSFSYENKPVFSGLNFSVKAGETVAIVGASGSGKTTLARLCCGLYMPDKGDVKVFDYSTRNNLNEARNMLAYVSQVPYIFSGTVKKNILLGLNQSSIIGSRGEYDEKDSIDGCIGDNNEQRVENNIDEIHDNTSIDNMVYASAAMANADNFINAMENGYNTVLDEKGSNISGGQKQRITIARALIRNSPLIIFDEATSSLDNESEIMIRNTIDGLIGKKTMLIIAHRLSTVKNASRIIVLDEGKIIEEGTHNQLMETKGAYYKLYNEVSR